MYQALPFRSPPLRGWRAAPFLVLPILLALVPPVPPARAADLVREFRFEPATVTLSPTAAGLHVAVRGGVPEFRPGEPDLPRVAEWVDLPEGFRVERVEVTALETEPLAEQARPTPALEVRRGEDPQAFSAADPAAYGREGWQPEMPAQLGLQGFERGRNLAAVEIAPVRWNAAGGRLERVRRIEVRLVLAPSAARPLARERVIPEWEDSGPAAARAARAAAPAALAAPAGRAAQPFRATQIPSLLGSPVAYVIVTNDEMAPIFQQLADWKTQCGLPAVVRTIGFIRQQYPLGADDAERVRLFLRDAYTRWGARWALLGGDVDVVPERLAHTTANGGEFIPSDLYYSCLDGNWNADGDSLWGEGYMGTSSPGDSADLLPEIWVGRAPVQDAGDAQLFVNKTLFYEKTPIADYMKNMLFFAQVMFPQPWTPGTPTTLDGAELVEYDLLPILDTVPWMHVARVYQNNTDPRWRPGSVHETRVGVLDSLARGYNFATHIGHGYITVMSTGDGNINNEDAFALQNGNRFMNLYAIDCTSNAIDFQSLGEAYMRAPEGGAVTSIGSTRLDWPTYGRYFQQEYFRLMFEDSVTAVGEAQGRQKVLFVGSSISDNLTRWTEFTLILLGDPELRIFTNTPRTLTVTAPASLTVSDSSLAVNVAVAGVPLYGARVTAWMAGRDYRSATTDGAGNVVLPFRPDTLGSVTLTVTAFNARPALRTIPVTTSSQAALEQQAAVVVDDNLSGRHGNDNGALDAGETVDVQVPIRNTGGASALNVSGTLSTSDGLISVSTAAVGYGSVAAGALSSPAAGFRVTIPFDCPDQREVPFRLDLVTSNGRHGSQSFSLVVRAPELIQVSHLESEPVGNGNGRPEPGETVSYAFHIRNLGTGSTSGIYGRLRSYDGLATVLDSAFTVPGLAAGAESTATPVRFVPSSTAARLALLLFDANGPRGTQTLDLGVPDAVTGLQGVPGPASIQLTWAHSPAPDLAGYHVYRRTWTSGPFVRVTAVPSSRTSAFDDVGLAPLTRYDYEVTAVDSSGNESAVSAVAGATTNPAMHAGYPRILGHSSPSPVAVEHLEPGVPQDVLVGANVLYAYRPDGSAPVDADGSPDTPGDFTTQGDYYAGGGSISDLDGDGSREVVGAAWNSQELWAFDRFGNVRSGFPVHLRDGVWSSVAIGDLNGDGSKELVFGSINLAIGSLGHDLFVFRSNGTEWMDGDSDPNTIGVFKVLGTNYNDGTPALADLLGNGQKEIVYGAFDGKLYAWKPDGSNAPGFPVNLGAPITASVAIGKLDGSAGPLSIVVPVTNDSLHVIRADGSRHPGFPVRVVSSGTNLAPSPALADMNNDGFLDIVYAGTDGRISVLDRNGAPLSPWLATRYSALTAYASQSSPVVADLNGDGWNDIVAGDENGSLAALSGATGQMLPGFPIQLGAAESGAPAVCDCDGDGKTEIVAMDYGRTLSMWDYDFPFSPGGPPPWPQFHHDAERTGNFSTPFLLAVDDARSAPRALELSAPRPNPARGPLAIAFGIPVGAAGAGWEIAIYDPAGRRIRTLERGSAPAGRGTVRWDLNDERGLPVHSGMYFVRAAAGGHAVARKVLVLR